MFPTKKYFNPVTVGDGKFPKWMQERKQTSSEFKALSLYKLRCNVIMVHGPPGKQTNKIGNAPTTKTSGEW
jgi:hypothetical protein